MDKTIHEPVGKVFATFTNLREAAHHVNGIKKLEVLTDGPIGVGTKFRETRVMFKRESTEEMEITSFEPNQSYSVGCHSCGVEFNTTFRFVPKGDSTEVQMNMNCKPVSLFAKIVSPLTSLMVGPTMKKCLNSDLDDLARVAEA
jgi:hypothetical protein